MRLHLSPGWAMWLGCLLVIPASPLTAETSSKPRLVVLTDIGGDPDDQQSMVRLMTYANEFDIEGLIATASGTPGELGVDVVKPHLIREIVEAYGQVRDNLARHARGYPPADQLLACLKRGNPHRGRKSLGDGGDTEGSRWIVDLVDGDDDRPLNIAIWGGATDLAQALWRVRHDRSSDQVRRFVSRLRVHSISHQDDTGPWIVNNFPDLFFVLSMQPKGRDKRESAYRGMYLGGDQSLTSRKWMDEHIRHRHGPLGALYPPKTWTAPNPHSAIKEGDTPSWFFFLRNGLNFPEHPEWGGWGGRFERLRGGLFRDAADTVDGATSARATVWRWRPAYQSDFQARMDWCVAQPGEANHQPSAVINGNRGQGLVIVTCRPGESVSLDASGSADPDGDSVSFHWWVYREAGTWGSEVQLEGERTPHARTTAPVDAAGRTIHLVLEVKDNGRPPLTAYRRILIQVKAD